MSHSLIGADRQTHGKIVAIALVLAATLLGAASSASKRSDAAAVKVTVVKAAKPVAVAQAGAVIR